jgi:iron-sulfur cluster assembly accessory protein
VPGDPDRLLLCRYWGVYQGKDLPEVVEQRFSRMAIARSLAEQFNHQPPYPRGCVPVQPATAVRPLATLCEVTDATSDTTQTAIALTDKAAGKIAELLGSQEDSEGQALRVAVRGGGCSGFQYALAFDRAKDDDHVFEVDGVSVLVDKVSMQFVFGSEVDYVEGLQGAGFQVNNPNVVAACGCGSSFQVKDDAAEHAAV